jgi:hypothetical protein
VDAIRRRDDPRGLPRVAKAEFDHDEPVLAQARTDGERHVHDDDLEMRHLQPLTAVSELTPGSKPSRTKLDPERRPGLGREDNDNGSLNTKHDDLLKEQTRTKPTGQSPGAGWFRCSRKSGAHRMGRDIVA